MLSREAAAEAGLAAWPMPSGRKLTIVVPFFNERPAISLLLAAIDDLAGRLQAQRIRVETILVDDGSRDHGGRAATDWVCARSPAFDLRLVRLSRNFGKELALSAGLEAADGDAIVLMDADLQHPVALVDRFVEAWLNDGYDVVYGYRESITREGLGKRLMRWAFHFLINHTSDTVIEPHSGDYRLMSRRAYEALRQFPERERLMKGLYGLIGFPTVGIAYDPAPRAKGASKFSALKVLALGLNGVTSFSVFPLRLTLLAGVALAILAAGYGLWTIVEKLVFGIHVAGYPTVVVIISMIGAGQLIGMGIVGEYVGKVLMEVKRRPLYIVQSDQRLVGRAVAAAPDRSKVA